MFCHLFPHKDDVSIYGGPQRVQQHNNLQVLHDWRGQAGGSKEAKSQSFGGLIVFQCAHNRNKTAERRQEESINQQISEYSSFHLRK